MQTLSITAENFSEKTTLKEAAQKLESVFLYELLKKMKDEVLETNFLGEKKQESAMYHEFFFQAVADEITKGHSLGLKEMILNAYQSHAKKLP